MAITTIQGVKDGLRSRVFFSKAGSSGGADNVWASLWTSGGFPAAGVADTATAGGVARSSTGGLVTGQIPHYDPFSGNSYLARLSASLSNSGGPRESNHVMLCDRLWDCGANSGGSALSPSLTSSQTIDSTAWPARDEDGSTNGKGVFIALEVTSTLGAGTPTFTLTYTNSAGTAGRTATNNVAVTSASQRGLFYIFGLDAGDVGVRSVQSIQASATQSSGQWVLTAFRPLLSLEHIAQSAPGAGVDALTAGFPRLYNGAVPFLLTRHFGANALVGSFQAAQG